MSRSVFDDRVSSTEIHFALPGGYAACHHPFAYPEFEDARPFMVTCKLCKRTKAFRAEQMTVPQPNQETGEQS